MNALVELRDWFRSTRKDRERVKAGGVEIHTMESGRRYVEADDVLQTDSARDHFKTMSDLTRHSRNGSDGKVEE